MNTSVTNGAKRIKIGELRDGVRVITKSSAELYFNVFRVAFAEKKSPRVVCEEITTAIGPEL